MKLLRNSELQLLPRLLFRFSSSVPNPSALPSVTENALLTSRIRNKRRLRRLAASANSAALTQTAYLNRSAPSGVSLLVPTDGSDSFASLPNIMGNILAVHCGTVLFPFNELAERDGVRFDYPWDSSLLAVIEAAAASWYGQNGETRKLPALLGLHGPSRRATWQMVRWIADRNRSHLAIVPVTLFADLVSRLQKGQAFVDDVSGTGSAFMTASQSASLSDFIVQNFRAVPPSAGSKGGRSSHQQAHLSHELASPGSRAAIQVIEYLFGCMEALLCPEGQGNVELTLFLDGFEEYAGQLRKGSSDGVMRDLGTWAALFQGSGRRIVLGGRNGIESSLGAAEASSVNEEDGNGNDQDSSSSSSSNTSIIVGLPGPSSPSASSSSASSSGAAGPASGKNPLQAIADLFLGGNGANSLGRIKMASIGSGESSPMPVNVRIEGNVLRLSLTGPKADRRQRHQFTNLVARDRAQDLFDGNVMALKQVAQQRWNLRPVSWDSGHLFASEEEAVWRVLGSAGNSILQKRRLTREELNELLICVLGRDFTLAEAAKALEHVHRLRHDPHQLSSDDLNHLLAGRGVALQALSKYEKRFVGCIATNTTMTRFSDVCLPNRVISSLRSVTTLPLLRPELFMRGVLKQSMTGVLLFGPPGTGKTMLAKAVAQESGAAFLAVNMSNIFDMWVGEGEKNVKGLFGLARKLAPAIIFVDEVDALLEKRTSAASRSSRLEVVNEFMSQWDGLASNLNQGVLVLGATNRPFALDDAVLRRLPRRLLIDLPESHDRLLILTQLFAEDCLSADAAELLPQLAKEADLYSGSDLKNVALAAGLKAALRHTNDSEALSITARDLREAFAEVPASLSDHMESLTELRKWNELYGEQRVSASSSGLKTKQAKFGFA